MKISDNTRYPHPVLNEYTDDFVSGKFTCEFWYEETNSDYIEIESEVNIGNKYLLELVNEGKASTGYYLICNQTYFNNLQIVSVGRTKKRFAKEKLFGTLILRPLIWTTDVIKDFNSDTINTEFERPCTVSKGAVIALGHEYRMSIDSIRFKPFETIFLLSKSEEVASNQVRVDINGEQIEILANKETLKNINDFRTKKTYRDILLSSLYLPVVMEVLTFIKEGESSFEGKLWYRVFIAKCDEIGIDVKKSGLPVLEIAQNLLRGPLIGIFNSMDSLK